MKKLLILVLSSSLIMTFNSCKKEECCDCPESPPGTGGFQFPAFSYCENTLAPDSANYDFEWEPLANFLGYSTWDEFHELMDNTCCDCYKE